MHTLLVHRRSPSPAWYATWRRRREWLRYRRGAAVLGHLDIWIPWGMCDDPDSEQLAAAAARGRLRGRFPHGVITLGAGELRCDKRMLVARWCFAFTVRRVVMVVSRA
jgi:hypothetical protein